MNKTRRIRIGKEFKLRWKVSLNLVKVDLTLLDLRLELKDPRGGRKTQQFAIEGDYIVATVLGPEQKHLGYYDVTLWANYGQVGQTVLDAVRAFELVPTTDLEDDYSNDNLAVETVNMSGMLQMGVQGQSAYDIWLQLGHVGSYADFIAWIQEPARKAAEELRTLHTQVADEEKKRVQAENDRKTAEELRAQKATEALQKLSAAEESAIDTAEHPTKIGTDHFVYTWNKVTKVYDKTNIYVKGDKFVFSDFTPEQIAQLQKPALDAATEATKATEKATEVAEHPTYIEKDNYVYRWNTVLKRYEKTEVFVKGDKGDKGDKFVFSDFTAGEIAQLQKPALDAAKEAQTATTKANEVADHPVKVEPDFYVYKWNPVTKAYVKTSIYLKGEKGDKMTFADLTQPEIAQLQQPAKEAAELAKQATTEAQTAAQNANTAAAHANGFKDYVSEYNVSKLHPTSGIGGTNKFTLSEAIKLIPADMQSVGIKCSFLENSGKVKVWRWASTDLAQFTNTATWVEVVDGSIAVSEVESAKQNALSAIGTKEQTAIGNFSAQRVTPEMLSESTKQLINASGGGTITNLADDEDTTSVNGVIKFADKAYNPAVHSGMGKKILRKNIVNGKNVLTQEMMSAENTIYIIQYNYDLNGAEITVPRGCVLQFDGGSLQNGTLRGSFEVVAVNKYASILINVTVVGSILTKEIEASWFGEISNKVDSSIAINAAIQTANSHNIIYLPCCEITVSNTILIDKGITLDGRNHSPRFDPTNAIRATVQGMSAITIGDGFIAGKLINVSVGPAGADMIRKFIGLNMSGCESFVVENVKVSEADIAYNLDTATQIALPLFNQIAAHNCNKGMYIHKTGSGWANCICVKPTWFTNNYIHFHITIGNVTTIEGGNVEIGNGNTTYPWFGPDSRGFLIEGNSRVNINGCIYGENIEPYYAEVKDNAVLNIVGESWILNRIKTSGYAKVYQTGSMVNMPSFISDEFRIAKPFYYLSAKNVHCGEYYHNFIDICKNGTMPDANVYMHNINGIPCFYRFNLKAKNPAPNILKSFTIGLKCISTLPSIDIGLLAGGGYDKPYLSFKTDEKRSYIYYHVSDVSPDNKNIFNAPSTFNPNNEYVLYTCLILFDSVKNEVVITSSDGMFNIQRNVNLSPLEFNAQNFLLNVSGDNKGNGSYMTDFVLFDKVLTVEEALYWINKLNHGGEDYPKIGDKTPDSAPLGFSFYDKKSNNILYKIEDRISPSGIPVIKWSTVNTNKSSLKIGTTAQRPQGVQIGYTYKDTDLKKWIIWNGTAWENLDGTALA